MASNKDLLVIEDDDDEEYYNLLQGSVQHLDKKKKRSIQDTTSICNGLVYLDDKDGAIFQSEGKKIKLETTTISEDEPLVKSKTNRKTIMGRRTNSTVVMNVNTSTIPVKVIYSVWLDRHSISQVKFSWKANFVVVVLSNNAMKVLRWFKASSTNNVKITAAVKPEEVPVNMESPDQIDNVRFVDTSSNNVYILAGGGDNTIRALKGTVKPSPCFNIAYSQQVTPTEFRQDEKYRDPITVGRFYPKNPNYVVLGYQSGEVILNCISQQERGYALCKYMFKKEPITSLDISGDLIVAVMYESGHLSMIKFDAEQKFGDPIEVGFSGSSAVEPCKGSYSKHLVLFRPGSDTQLVIKHDSALYLFDRQRDQVVNFKHSNITSVAMSCGGEFVVCASMDGTIHKLPITKDYVFGEEKSWKLKEIFTDYTFDSNEYVTCIDANPNFKEQFCIGTNRGHLGIIEI